MAHCVGHRLRRGGNRCGRILLRPGMRLLSLLASRFVMRRFTVDNMA
jgi:hypothetical protein